MNKQDRKHLHQLRKKWRERDRKWKKYFGFYIKPSFYVHTALVCFMTILFFWWIGIPTLLFFPLLGAVFAWGKKTQRAYQQPIVTAVPGVRSTIMRGSMNLLSRPALIIVDDMEKHNPVHRKLLQYWDSEAERHIEALKQ